MSVAHGMLRTMHMRSTHSYDDRNVEVGAKWPDAVDEPRFRVEAECISVDPEHFISRLTLGASVLHTTAEYKTPHEANAAARVWLTTRWVEVLKDS